MRYKYKYTLATVIGVLVVLVGSVLVFSGGGDGSDHSANVGGGLNNSQSDSIDMAELVACLDQAEVVIYGSVTCPFCTQLANSFGGYEVINPIYVECGDEPDRCHQEMQTRGVPEIQIEGELYQGPREPADLAEAAGCEW